MRRGPLPPGSGLFFRRPPARTDPPKSLHTRRSGAFPASVPRFPCFLLLALCAICVALSGCSTSSARKVIALDRFQRIYVETRLNENHRLDEVLVAQLRALGREASSGPLTMMPEKTDAVLTYDARWAWDFHTYLIDLTIELHTVHPRKKLADARYYQPTVRPKPPAEVVREVLVPLFKSP